MANPMIAGLDANGQSFQREMTNEEYTDYLATKDSSDDVAAAILALLRSQRDTLLAATDRYFLTDPAPFPGITTSAEWEAYRQQLRDWPDQPGFDPLNPPAWPISPA